MQPYRSPWLTAEHDLFRENVRRFIETELVPHRERWIEQGHMDPAYWRKAGEVGLLCPDVPTEYGGGGVDFGFDAIVFEELSRACISGFGAPIQSIVAHYMLVYGTEEQKQRWLPKMASGEIITSIAMTEPEDLHHQRLQRQSHRRRLQDRPEGEGARHFAPLRRDGRPRRFPTRQAAEEDRTERAGHL